jgi:prepilin-type N-terminal cleavage/methylation domain-containing protein
MKQRGFTLIETVVYIGIFGMIMTGAMVTLYTLLHSVTNNRAVISAYTEMNFVTQKLDWALSGASAITLISSSSLKITRPDLGEDSPMVVSIDQGQFYLARGSSNQNALSDASFLITDGMFSVGTSSFGSSTEVALTYRCNDIPFLYRTFISNGP